MLLCSKPKQQTHPFGCSLFGYMELAFTRATWVSPKREHVSGQADVTLSTVILNARSYSDGVTSPFRGFQVCDIS